MSFHFSKRRYTNGEPILAKAAIANGSDAPYQFWLARARELDFNLLVQKEDAPFPLQRTVELNAVSDFQRQLTRIVVQGKLIRVEPHGRWEQPFELDKIYDLTRPGTYAVDAALRVESVSGSVTGYVHSPTATFEVLPGRGVASISGISKPPDSADRVAVAQRPASTQFVAQASPAIADSPPDPPELFASSAEGVNAIDAAQSHRQAHRFTLLGILVSAAGICLLAAIWLWARRVR